MTDKEKLLRIFREVHGDFSNSFSLEIEEDDNYTPIRVNVMKSGDLCWSADREQLLFDYITRDFK